MDGVADASASKVCHFRVLGKVACEICGEDNTDEISVGGKIDNEADVRCVVMNFELFIEESSSFDGWSVCAYDQISDAVLGACFT